MATKIVTKNSSTASAVPTASDLVQGELAVNVADKRLFTEDNAGAIVELGTNPTTLTVTGEITANGGIALGDNDKATFGAGDDLQIYHDGSDSYIKDEGTGNLYLTTNGSTMNLQAGSDNMVKIYKDAQVEIFHDASVKLATTSTGIDVTGTATMDGLTVDTAAPFMSFKESGATKLFIGESSAVGGGAGYYDFYAVTGLGQRFFTNSVERLRIDSSGNVGIGTSSSTVWNGASGTKLLVGGASNTITSLQSSSTAINQGGIFEAYATAQTSGTNAIGSINFLRENTSVSAISGFAAFYTSSSGAVAERMRIDSSGRVGIGTSSPAKLLHLSESADGSKLRITRAGVSEWDFSIGNTSTFTGVGSGALEIIALNGGTAEELAIGRTGVGTPYVHVTSSGVTFSGAISKGSGSFKIDHPLPEKTETHHLVHSFVESPQADNIYRGKVNLVDGLATVNIDDAAGMTEGTYVLLNTNTQCFTSNESGWTAVKGSVSGNILTITAQESCSDTISWMVVGERHDQHMLDTEWTDENGKVIVEPLKQLEE